MRVTDNLDVETACTCKLHAAIHSAARRLPDRRRIGATIPRRTHPPNHQALSITHVIAAPAPTSPLRNRPSQRLCAPSSPPTARDDLPAPSPIMLFFGNFLYSTRLAPAGLCASLTLSFS